MSKAVRMRGQIQGGWYDGAAEDWRDYPALGEVGVFDDGHADSLVAGGYAIEVKGAEARQADPAETRPADQGATETREAKDDDEAASPDEGEPTARRSGPKSSSAKK
jgi:hypothetical protein